MGRRIRPKTRPKASSGDEHNPKKRIKIRMRRDSSDTIESLLIEAKKEAGKIANFKGFKAGVKSGIKKEKKRSDKLVNQLNAAGENLQKENTLTTKLAGRLRVVEKALSSIVHTITDNNFNTRLLLNLNEAGVRMASADEHGLLATNKWVFRWDQSSVLRDEDGVDRVESSMQRHRLHPGHRIPIREMWPIWNAVPVTERPDIDPVQGMRGAWYWNARRYSTHSSAMNAWRRHMHQKYLAESERESRDRLMPQLEDEDAFGEVIADSDAAYVDVETPEYREVVGANAERLTRNWRNRINGFLRSCELESCSYWTKHYTDRQNQIDGEHHNDLNAFNRVCAHFAVPLYDWDNDNWDAFRGDVNYYIEVVQNMSDVEAGTPSTRSRRSGRFAVRGYNRENY